MQIEEVRQQAWLSALTATVATIARDHAGMTVGSLAEILAAANTGGTKYIADDEPAITLILLSHTLALPQALGLLEIDTASSNEPKTSVTVSPSARGREMVARYAGAFSDNAAVAAECVLAAERQRRKPRKTRKTSLLHSIDAEVIEQVIMACRDAEASGAPPKEEVHLVFKSRDGRGKDRWLLGLLYALSDDLLAGFSTAEGTIILPSGRKVRAVAERADDDIPVSWRSRRQPDNAHLAGLEVFRSVPAESYSGRAS